MSSSIVVQILPPLLFFIAFSVIFSILEMLLVLVLNQLTHQNWEWFVDVVIRTKVHHKRLVRIISLLLVGFLILGVIIFTPLVEILTLASYEFRWFAAALGLVMVLIFIFSVRDNTKLHIQRKIYGLLFFIISILVYVQILSIANGSYDDYKRYISERFIDPAVTQIEKVSDEREQEEILNHLRTAYLAGKCKSVDYTKEEKENLLKNIQLIAQEPELAFGDKFVNIDDPEESLRGKACSDGAATLLLIENGNWYWVNEEYIQFID